VKYNTKEGVMFQASCADIGTHGCAFVAEGKKSRKVFGQMIVHLRNEHPEMVAGITDDQLKDLEARVASCTHEAL
jgi:predicted small metal-binding protein